MSTSATPQIQEVRAWLREHGHPVNAKGRIAPALWQVYADAHPGFVREEPKQPNGRCITCGRKWAGLREAHCTVCHRQFSTPAHFDLHRAGGRSSRGECADPLTILGPDGEARLRIRESPWGPIYVLNQEHWAVNAFEGKEHEWRFQGENA